MASSKPPSALPPDLRTNRLLGFARDLQSAATFEDLLVITRAELEQATGYLHAWMFVADTEDAAEWRLIDSAGAIRGEVWKYAPVLRIEGDAMMEEITRSDEPVVVVDARTDPRTNKQIVAQLGNRTIINVPLRLLDKPFGAFGTGTFGDAEGCRAPTQAQLDYLVGMASQLSVAAGRIRFIEERRRLERSEATNAAVIEAALDAIVLMNHEGEILEFNAAAERTFGYTRAEVVGKALADVMIPPAVRVQHRAGLQRYLDTGEHSILGKRIEVQAMRKDGTEFPAEVAVVRILSEGEPVFTGYIRDITERRQAAEAELLRRENEAALAANRELEAFSYSIAHDLRAPLRGMSGFSDALLEDYGDKLDEGGRDMLQRVSTGAKRMGELIDALLALGRLSRTEPRRESVDLTQLARAVLDELRASDPKRTADVVVDDGLTVTGDPKLLRAVLENLLGNAWKFTRDRSPARIELHRTTKDGAVAYSVHDNGAGFKPEYAHRLFTPFQRLHSAAQFEGTGIGLATVDRIIRRHGGRVWADGAEEGGATFYFTLPEQPNKAAVGSPR